MNGTFFLLPRILIKLFDNFTSIVAFNPAPPNPIINMSMMRSYSENYSQELHFAKGVTWGKTRI